MNGLVAHNLTCSRGGRIIFYDVNFTVQSGQSLALAGSNGSGKSTLLRALAGLIEPLWGSIRRPAASGWILFDHKDTLKTKLTLYENLKFWSAVYQTSAVLIDEALETFGLRHLKDLPVHVLSLGQRQRLSLCRLCLCTSHIWLLDEPARSLDEEGRESLELLLRTHLENGGIAVMATHENSPRFQGHILNLDHGRMGGWEDA